MKSDRPILTKVSINLPFGNQAIKLQPDKAHAYYNRGNAKSELGYKQGAISDYNQAAQLYSQQNKMDDYYYALNQVKKLEIQVSLGRLFGLN